MAILVPTEPVLIQQYRYRRDHPILSGEATGDLEYGMRGITAACNHAYAHRTQTLVDVTSDYKLWTEDTGSPVVILGVIPVTISADVSSITVTVDIEDGYSYVIVDAATTNGNTITGRDADIYTASITPGDHVLQIGMCHRAGVAEGYIYSVHIEETPLVAGDFPA